MKETRRVRKHLALRVIFFAKFYKKALALARIACYNIVRKREEGYKKESPSEEKER